MEETIVIPDSLELEPGMELGEDIVNRQGILILPKGIILDDRLIDRLINMDVKDITILKREEDNISSFTQEMQLFEEDYQQQTALVEENLNDIIEGGTIDAEQLFKISQDLIGTLKNREDVFRYITELNEAYNEVYAHSLNVALICHLFTIWGGFSEDEAKELVTAGLLHDIGKSLPGGEYQNHTVLGAQFLAEHGASKNIQMAVLMHHEKEDGSGFPLRVTGSDIHHYAKIISIADYYENATIGGKSLQEKICPFNLIRMFENQRYGIFDIKYMDVFLSKIANYYVGHSVRLTDDRVGKIVFINKHCLSKPIIQIDEKILDTYYEKNLQIKEVI